MYCYIRPFILQDDRFSSARYLKYINSIIIAVRHYLCIVHFVTFVLDEKRSIHLIITMGGCFSLFSFNPQVLYITPSMHDLFILVSHFPSSMSKPSYHPTFLNLYRTAYSRLHIELNHFRIILFCNATEEGR